MFSILLRSNHLIFIFFVQPKEFPNPTTIDPHRPKASYNLNGTGFHVCTGAEYAEQTIAEILSVVFKLQNVRRASGDAGRLSGFTEIVNETENNVFIKPNGTTSPWPGSMYLVVSRGFFFLLTRFLFILTVGFQYDQWFCCNCQFRSLESVESLQLYIML